jgi:imidazolonepropionase-like amidohydrolase
MEGLIGCITPGSFADIIILDANPLENIRVLDRPETYLLAVIKEGRVISSRIDGLGKEVE